MYTYIYMYMYRYIHIYRYIYIVYIQALKAHFCNAHQSYLFEYDTVCAFSFYKFTPRLFTKSENPSCDIYIHSGAILPSYTERYENHTFTPCTPPTMLFLNDHSATSKIYPVTIVHNSGKFHNGSYVLFFIFRNNPIQTSMYTNVI